MTASAPKADAPNPIKQQGREIGKLEDRCKRCSISRQVPPNTVGIAKRKENRTASLLFQPRNRAQEIVDALLEIPGIRAAACIEPMKSASRRRLDH